MTSPLAALTRRELLRLLRNPAAIFTSLLIPILYITLFGQGFSGIASGEGAHLPPGFFLSSPNYFSSFACGMVGFVAVTGTLFTGANVIFDKLFGIFKRIAASPASSSSVFLSRVIAGSVQPTLLAFFVMALAIGLGHTGISSLNGLDITQAVTVLGGFEILIAILLLSAMFAGLFVAIGFALQQPQSYFAAVNALNLPVLLTSNAIYPWGAMPHWLQVAATYNPVSLCVNVIRENLFGTAYYAHPPYVYLGGLVAWTVGVFVIATLLARRTLAAKT
ncbi:MAG TPA: ABC transporter permease [Thermoplasmata archaeon]|nr:ABC transporter permease [Thermoplasmata archaeon]